MFYQLGDDISSANQPVMASNHTVSKATETAIDSKKTVYTIDLLTAR